VICTRLRKKPVRQQCPLLAAIAGCLKCAITVLDHFVGAFFFAQASRLYNQEAREVLV
jgi:hypothetical protein